jgi:catechol 2,3-dioxygenase-like lactoylglutathione lyase family enzyme
MSKAQVFIDHITLPVRDFQASQRFYRQALAPFGVEEVEAEGAVGWDHRAGSTFSSERASQLRRCT